MRRAREPATAALPRDKAVARRPWQCTGEASGSYEARHRRIPKLTSTPNLLERSEPRHQPHRHEPTGASTKHRRQGWPAPTSAHATNRGRGLHWKKMAAIMKPTFGLLSSWGRAYPSVHYGKPMRALYLRSHHTVGAGSHFDRI